MIMDDYYSTIASSYNELYGEEQKGKFELISRHLKLKPLILDVGCGTGIVDFGARTVGIDPSIGLLMEHPGLRVCACAEALPFKSKVFSSAISLTVLHHTDINKAIAEIKRVSKRDAVYAFTVLKKAKNAKSIVSKLKSSFSLLEIEGNKDIILVRH